MSATVTVGSITDSKIEIALTDDLDDEIFDFPLTIKTEVSASWKDIIVVQAGDTQSVEPVNESGNLSIYYDAVPDRGTIEIFCKEQVEIIYSSPTYSGNSKSAQSSPVSQYMIYTLQGKLVHIGKGTVQNSIITRQIKNGVYIYYSPEKHTIKRLLVIP